MLFLEKQGPFYDPFVMEQLLLGNFLSRKATLEIVNSSVYILTNDHMKVHCKSLPQQQVTLYIIILKKSH